MKSLLLSAACLSCAVLAGTVPSSEINEIRTGNFLRGEPKALKSATILNWNIERGSRFGDIEAAIRKHKPDVCVLQEVDLHARRSGGRDVAADLAKEFQYSYVYASEFQELSQGMDGLAAYHGQAILSRLPLVNERVLRFQNQSSFWRPHSILPARLPLFQRRLGGRIALIGELNSPTGKLAIYDLHLESRENEAFRLKQLREVLADADRYPPDTTILIAGDLNSVMPWSPLTPALRQAGYRSALGDRRVRTHVIYGALDWVFAKGPGQLKDGRVDRRDRGSDHFPVLVDLRLN